VTSNQSIPGLAAPATIGIVTRLDVAPGGKVIVSSTGWYCTPGVAEGTEVAGCVTPDPFACPHTHTGTSGCAEPTGVEGVEIGPVAISTWIGIFRPGRPMRRVNVTELACWLATAWMPLVVLPASTKLKGSGARPPPAGTFMVLSNSRPSSDSRRGHSLGGVGSHPRRGTWGFRSKHPACIGGVDDRSESQPLRRARRRALSHEGERRRSRVASPTPVASSQSSLL
jgi:hypothetical protein